MKTHAFANVSRERTAEITEAYYIGSSAKSHANSLILRVSVRDRAHDIQQHVEPHSLIIVHPLIITFPTFDALGNLRNPL